MEQIQSRLQTREVNGSIECHDYTDDVSKILCFIYYIDKNISLYNIILFIVIYLKRKE